MMISCEQITLRYSLLNWRKYWSQVRPIEAGYALKDVCCQFNSGVHIILGPNGAGKTTLLQVLTGQIIPSCGTVRIDGQLADRSHLRRCINYLPQNFGLYPQFTAVEQLDYVALLQGITDRRQREAAVAAVLLQTGLVEAAQLRVATYSRGMCQQVGIAQTLLDESPFLLLDEPTAGLDPEARNRLRALLVQLGQQRSVILASSLLADAHCADSILILVQGQVCFHGTPAELEAVGNQATEMLVQSGEMIDQFRDVLECGYRAVLWKQVNKCRTF